jgi:DnaK suppressor protein
MATAHSDALNPQFGGAYRPSANEEFMNPEQLSYFRGKLLGWKDEILKESRETMTALASGPLQEADLTDRASSETDWGIHLRTRDRQRKLIAKIDSALRRIETANMAFAK